MESYAEAVAGVAPAMGGVAGESDFELKGRDGISKDG